MLCVEFQYLRAITGSADGKIRIWNILNGDCIRVMRGNSMCDPIVSMTILDNRILVNTENNVILMEYEIIKYEYGSNRDEIAELSMVTMDQSANQMPAKRNKNYSAIRASRMELVSTPNVKLFNDDRKSVLSHSSRPISAKCFKDAQFIHKIVSKNAQPEARKNSAGHISESALIKRRSIMQSINAVISNNGSFSILSSNPNPNAEFFNRLEKITSESPGNYEDELDSARIKPFDLIETKQYLRDQLNEIKQTEQKKFSPEFFESNFFVKKEHIDTKSCADGNPASRMVRVFHFSPSEPPTFRPTSSPSRVDTKTRVKINIEEISKLSMSDTDNDSSKQIIKNEDQRKELYNFASQNPQTLVTKIFESQETDLKSNTNMFPVNVKSKIPNPKIINMVRPLTVFGLNEKDKFSGNSLNMISYNISGDNVHRKTSNEHIKSTVPVKAVELKDNLLNRPKSSTIRRTYADVNLETIETSKLSNINNLNLMTYKEIDKVMDTINGIHSTPDIEEEKRKAEVYKKLWILKSKGHYHGSLLAKPKAVAPEIRE